MELNKWTIAGGVIGIICLIISIVQYFLVKDFSHLVFGIGLGLTILGFSYIHECLKLHDKHAMNDARRLDELFFWAKTQGFDK